MHYPIYTKNVNTADSFLQIVYTYILRQELECVENAARKIPRSFFTHRCANDWRIGGAAERCMHLE